MRYFRGRGVESIRVPGGVVTISYLSDTLLVLATVQDGPGDAARVLALEEEGLGFAVLEAEDLGVATDVDLALQFIPKKKKVRLAFFSTLQRKSACGKKRPKCARPPHLAAEKRIAFNSVVVDRSPHLAKIHLALCPSLYRIAGLLPREGGGWLSNGHRTFPG